MNKTLEYSPAEVSGGAFCAWKTATRAAKHCANAVETTIRPATVTLNAVETRTRAASSTIKAVDTYF